MIKNIQRLNAAALPKVEIENGFLGERQKTNRDRTIPAIYYQMKKTGRLDAWRLDWQPDQPKPHIFWDSDTGKWIEAVSHSLATHPNHDFEAQIDEVVDLIEQAQQPDGYLNIFYTAVEPDYRWRNLRDKHELYCAGHLMESAVAYYEATGKRKLLDVLLRYSDHIDAQFGPNEGQRRGYCGHPEVELALVKLYRATGEKRYLNLSKYFIEERGQQPHYFDVETQARGEDPRVYWAKTYHYCQAHLPIREQTQATGHAVRVAYLFSGVADIVAETGDSSLLEVCRAVWDDVTQHAMYITGGLGPAHANEGFTFAYDLPNETAYAETCASIGLAFWAHRMFHIDPDSRYMDVFECALYNGILSGVSFEGEQFFYANPLASYPNINPYEHWSGIHTERYYRRSEWFQCACCPPNLARFVASLGTYFYSTTGDTVYAHLYNQNRAHFNLDTGAVQIEQDTQYPFDGTIHFRVKVEQPANFTLALRIPSWCHDFQLHLNGTPLAQNPINGYVHISRAWADGDEVTLTLPMPVERMVAHPQIRQNAGRIALQRGPVVYCLEEVDNGPHLMNIVMPRDAQLTPSFDKNLFGGVGVITGDAFRTEPANGFGSGLYQAQSALTYNQSQLNFKAIPYCFWANRQPGEMRVWLREI